MQRKTEDSLKKRYLYKLSTNIISAGIYMITQIVVPRALGPRSYGDFNFLSNFFSQIINFLDMGTSTCFYTKLSQRQKESELVLFYMFFAGVVSLAVFVFVVVSQLTGVYSRFWPAQHMLFVYYGALFGILMWVVQILNRVTDAYGITVSSEKARIAQRLAGLIIILTLFGMNRLNLNSFFFYNYFVLIALGIAFVWIIHKSGFLDINKLGISMVAIKQYVGEFYHYSHPLFMYSLVALLIGVFDRWLLQIYGGSVQQGYFGLSFQIGAFCFLFTSAMTPLLMREFSILSGENNIERMSMLFQRYVPLLCGIITFFSCFVAIEADKIIYVFGGDKYRDAFYAVAIMSFFPIHQTYEHISSSMFYATGQTVIYRNIGIVVMLIGLPVTYCFIAPKERFGINAGATGLALKMVLLQFIGANIGLYFNTRFLRLRYGKYFLLQFACIGYFLVLAFFARESVKHYLIPAGNIFVSFIASGLLYTVLVIIFVWLTPFIVGLRRADISDMVKLAVKKNSN
ncbi:MAG TPA: oligosaccharide flippase family protein [Syntrophorhabdaceae bacterium]|nr:oligosaccharide flippase family protein [Syntrophorhabdaceae bacterium]HOG39209.1 oligosaccharide flippase family protein [Syntrophorhabdaceae bacterium]HQJ93371.1 oligosaccharide flippase family protein [Syntrophorhabdaceae bacterium]